MIQIIFNYFQIFGLPIIIGLVSRGLLQKFSKAYFVTVLFAVLTIVGWIVVITVPSHGSELYIIKAVQATTAFVSSLLIGLIFRLQLKKGNK